LCRYAAAMTAGKVAALLGDLAEVGLHKMKIQFQPLRL
jgi:hypothetical protein